MEITALINKHFGEIPEEKINAFLDEFRPEFKSKEEHEKVVGQRDSYKEKFETADASLKRFEGIDPEKVQEEIQKYEDDKKQLEESYKKQIAAMEYDTALKDYFSNPDNEVEFTSEYAKKAFMQEVKEMDFKVSDGLILGLSDYVKQVREKDAGVFVDVKQKELKGKSPTLVIGAPMNQGGGGRSAFDISREDFFKMTYEQRLELKEKNPELFAQLNKRR